MNAVEFLTWGKEHNYPQLVLRQAFPGDILRAGERAWYGVVEGKSNGRLQQAIARVEDFQQRYASNVPVMTAVQTDDNTR